MPANELFHPANQLTPHIIKKKIEHCLPTTPIGRDGGKEVSLPSVHILSFPLLIPTRTAHINYLPKRSYEKKNRQIMLYTKLHSHRSLQSNARYSSIKPSASITLGNSSPWSLLDVVLGWVTSTDGLHKTALRPCTHNLTCTRIFQKWI